MDANKPAPQGHGVAAEPDRVSTRLVVTASASSLTLMAIVAAVLMVALFRTLDRGAEKTDEQLVAAAGLQRRESRSAARCRGCRSTRSGTGRTSRAAERERLDDLRLDGPRDRRRPHPDRPRDRPDRRARRRPAAGAGRWRRPHGAGAAAVKP